jgi:hypothetical protein
MRAVRRRVNTRGLQGVRSRTRTGSLIHRSGAVAAMIAPSGRSGVGWAAYWQCAAAQVSCRATVLGPHEEPDRLRQVVRVEGAHRQLFARTGYLRHLVVTKNCSAPRTADCIRKGSVRPRTCMAPELPCPFSVSCTRRHSFTGAVCAGQRTRPGEGRCDFLLAGSRPRTVEAWPGRCAAARAAGSRCGPPPTATPDSARRRARPPSAVGVSTSWRPSPSASGTPTASRPSSSCAARCAAGGS